MFLMLYLVYPIIKSDSQELNMWVSCVMAVRKNPLLEPDGSVLIVLTMIYVRNVLWLMCMIGIIRFCALTNLVEKGMLSWQSIEGMISLSFCPNSHNFMSLISVGILRI